VTVGGIDYRNSLIVAPDTLMADWPVRSIQDLVAAHLDAALELEPEVLLLGTGTRLSFPPHALYASVISRGVGFEVMDTAAACRTFNILLAEDRRVVAALIVEPAPAG